jgi:hypothetical protein
MKKTNSTAMMMAVTGGSSTEPRRMGFIVSP